MLDFVGPLRCPDRRMLPAEIQNPLLQEAIRWAYTEDAMTIMPTPGGGTRFAHPRTTIMLGRLLMHLRSNDPAVRSSVFHALVRMGTPTLSQLRHEYAAAGDPQYRTTLGGVIDAITAPREEEGRAVQRDPEGRIRTMTRNGQLLFRVDYTPMGFVRALQIFDGVGMVTYVPQGNGVFATNEGPRRVITSLNIEHDTALVTYRDGRGSRSISPYE